jgi:GNAT superfamily N-acetyltransferase
MRFADKFGFYELNPMPGCNQVVISNHAFIYPEFRGKGLGQKQHQERLDKARELGYNYILCTVQLGNKAEEAILKKNGWSVFATFLNKETQHNVEIYGKSLHT